VLLEEDTSLGAEEFIPSERWAEAAELVVVGIGHHEELYEAIARVTGQPSRRDSDIELGEHEIIEDAEVLELIAAAGEDAVTDD
jgi:hypothetical protein